MNIDEYTTLLERPYTATAQQLADIEQLLLDAPYCASARMLRLRILRETDNLRYGAELPRTAPYAANARALHQFVYSQPQQPTKRVSRHSGDYFDMMETMEQAGGNTRETLQAMAAKLKQARETLTTPPAKTKPVATMPKAAPPKPARTTPAASYTEADLQAHLQKKQYAEALIVLKQLNLNNSEKSAYFVDQIHFLETALKWGKHEC